jgi:hypothetical protein
MLLFPQRSLRSFYTYLPATTTTRAPCLVLADGSTLTARPHSLAAHLPTLPAAALDESRLPPRVHSPGARDALTPAEIGEATTLRRTDPQRWSVKELAAKFGVDREYVKLRIPVSREYREALSEQRDGEFEGMHWIQKRRVLTRMRKRMAW